MQQLERSNFTLTLSGALEQHFIIFAPNLPFGTRVALRAFLHGDERLQWLIIPLNIWQYGYGLFLNQVRFKRIDYAKTGWFTFIGLICSIPFEYHH
jgi:hypothetical protein